MLVVARYDQKQPIMDNWNRCRDQLKAAEEALVRIQGKLEGGDYSDVLTAARRWLIGQQAPPDRESGAVWFSTASRGQRGCACARCG